MTQAYLDPNSYIFVGGFTVQNKRDLIVPESLLLSETMLIKWQIRNLAKGATIEQIPPATLSAVLEIPGMGQLEANTFSVSPSQQGRDRVQLISLDPTLPYKITFSDVSDLVANSVLEFYTFKFSMSNTNNPVNIDTSAITAAITAASVAQVAAIQATSKSENPEVKRIVESSFNPVLWSEPSNHIAVAPDATDRIAVKLFNNGEVAVAYDAYIDISQKASTPHPDNVIQPWGETVVTAEEAKMGILLYTLTAIPSDKTAIILITEEFASAETVSL